jgi:hypothetical protein
LIKETVAALTFGPVQARDWRGDARVDVRRRERVRVWKCIFGGLSTNSLLLLAVLLVGEVDLGK